MWGLLSARCRAKGWGVDCLFRQSEARTVYECVKNVLSVLLHQVVDVPENATTLISLQILNVSLG